MKDSQTIVYDFDGMLFESNGYFTDSILPSGNKEIIFDPDLYEKCKIGILKFDEFFVDVYKRICKISGIEMEIKDLKLKWFEHSTINKEILKIAHQLYDLGFQNYILTDNVEERIKYLDSKYSLSELFKISGSFKLGKLKKDIAYYQDFLKSNSLSKNNTFFFDDKAERVELLAQNGFNAFIYKDIETFKTTLSKILEITVATN